MRVILTRCWLDAAKCARGIDALRLYRAEYDDKVRDLLRGFEAELRLCHERMDEALGS